MTVLSTYVSIVRDITGEITYHIYGCYRPHAMMGLEFHAQSVIVPHYYRVETETSSAWNPPAWEGGGHPTST
jgi:hypothetical protein